MIGADVIDVHIAWKDRRRVWVAGPIAADGEVGEQIHRLGFNALAGSEAFHAVHIPNEQPRFPLDSEGMKTLGEVGADVISLNRRVLAV